MKIKHVGSTAMAITLATLTGCGFGSATTEGDIAGYSFNIQTVYAWVQATTYDYEEDKYEAAEHQRLNIVLSGAKFDPSTDQRFVSIEDQFARAEQELLNGNIRIEISNFEKMASGDSVTAATAADEPAEGEPSLRLDFDFAAREVAPDAEYPAAPVYLGTRTTYTVKLDSVEGAPGDEISGTLTMHFQKSDLDSDRAKLGTITVNFTAKLISEVIARCSGGVLSDSSDCDLHEPEQGYP